MRELDGSISAEHGIGRLKRDELTHYKSPVEIELMRRVKHALDPDDIMNPGKIVSVAYPPRLARHKTMVQDQSREDCLPPVSAALPSGGG